jgi:hypothetical protein
MEKSWRKNLKGRNQRIILEKFSPNTKGFPLIYKNDVSFRAPKGNPAGTGGMELKILSAGREGSPAKFPQLPQISYSSHYLQVLTKNFDLNLTQILEIKSNQYLKTSI